MKFNFLKTFLVVASFTNLSVTASADQSSRIEVGGVAVSGTESYVERMDLILAAFEKTADETGKLSLVQRNFKDFCLDEQSAQNRVEWSVAGDSQSIALACFNKSDLDNGKAISLKLNSDGTLTDAISSDIAIHVEKCTKRPMIYIAQGIGIAASTVVSGIAAKKILNDGGDKQLHAGASALMTSLFGSILHTRFNLSPARSATYGAIAACTLGAIKEYTDPMFNRVGEGADNKANLIGCAIGWVATYVINRTIDNNQDKFYKSSSSDSKCRR